jgi:hypothetical protein
MCCAASRQRSRQEPAARWNSRRLTAGISCYVQNSLVSTVTRSRVEGPGLDLPRSAGRVCRFIPNVL